jgi:hypothetical protein
MKATELRIGNLAQDQNGNILEVVTLEEEKVIFKVLDRSKYPLPNGWKAEPTPITEEILLKCEGYKQNYGIEINDNTQLDFVITNDAVYPFITQNGEFSGQLPSQVNLEKIQHLHQLQNLYFALTGDELEINL